VHDWVCPVYQIVENERKFFVDAVVTPTDDEWSEQAARAKAEHIAAALNKFG
jgi:hypothetical protein